MNESRARVAGDIAYHLSEENSRIVVALGQERLRALQTAGVALDARCTQTAGILFAATAFTAGFVMSEHTPVVARLLGFFACILFVVGSGNACFGMMARKTHVPGVAPSWWIAALDHDQFTEKQARSWLAEATEEMIDVACKLDETRAENLNWALIHGFAGALSVAVAVATRLF